jgi:hypothetical protein
MSPNLAALLDRLANPALNALADLRGPLEQLTGEIYGHIDMSDEGPVLLTREDADRLWLLAESADKALESLTGVLEDS